MLFDDLSRVWWKFVTGFLLAVLVSFFIIMPLNRLFEIALVADVIPTLVPPEWILFITMMSYILAGLIVTESPKLNADSS